MGWRGREVHQIYTNLGGEWYPTNVLDLSRTALQLTYNMTFFLLPRYSTNHVHVFDVFSVYSVEIRI